MFGRRTLLLKRRYSSHDLFETYMPEVEMKTRAANEAKDRLDRARRWRLHLLVTRSGRLIVNLRGCQHAQGDRAGPPRLTGSRASRPDVEMTGAAPEPVADGPNVVRLDLPGMKWWEADAATG